MLWCFAFARLHPSQSGGQTPLSSTLLFSPTRCCRAARPALKLFAGPAERVQPSIPGPQGEVEDFSTQALDFALGLLSDLAPPGSFRPFPTCCEPGRAEGSNPARGRPSPQARQAAPRLGTCTKDSQPALYHPPSGRVGPPGGGPTGQIFRTTAKPQLIARTSELSSLQHRVLAKSSARDLPRFECGIAMRGGSAGPVTQPNRPTGYAPGLARSEPIVSRVNRIGMRVHAPSMSSILEAFRC